MLEFLVGLLAFTLERVNLRLARHNTWLLDSWGKQSHEVLVVNQISIFINHGNSDDVVVCVDLMHHCAHHNKSLFGFDDLLRPLLLLARFRLDLMILAHCLEGTSHQEFSVGSLTILDDECLTFLLNLISDFFDELLIKNFIN